MLAGLRTGGRPPP